MSYLVAYDVRAMAVHLGCPLTESGELQPCMTYTGTGEMAVAGTCLARWEDLPDPPVGVAYLAPREIVAVNPAGRSDQCQ